MPQLDFNVVLTNFLIIFFFFVFFYLFLNFFFLRRIFSVLLYRVYLSEIFAKRINLISQGKNEIGTIYKTTLLLLLKFFKLL